MHLIHNEQIKLLATWCNNISVLFAFTGAALPYIDNAGHPPFLRGLSAIGAWVIAVVAHVLGTRVLKRLREEASSAG